MENMQEKDRKTAFYAGMFRLQMGYLHQRLCREPWWGMDYGVGNFTMLKAISKFAEGPRYDLDDLVWRRMLAGCWDALIRSRANSEREVFVEDLWIRFGERWMRAYPLFEASLAQRSDYFGCFRYEYSAGDNSIVLHFQNREEPQSPLADLRKRREDLRRIVADVEAKPLQISRLRFETWMNNLQPVRSLFPECFARSLVPAEEFPKGYGWWGQFVTRDGGLQPRRAERLMAQGRFEFARLDGQCPWEEFCEFAVRNGFKHEEK